MRHAASSWADWLLDRMKTDLAAAVGDGLTVDAIAIGSAHMAHGAQLAVHAGQLPPDVVAEYLRALADAVEEEAPALPMMITVQHAGRV
ncbi:hypothetical protein [Caenispirillum bisanense]|uniref:Uncharacterized protein n=1 Tax=Caenispirillum bisanense TaxID=414052 RepID=A0A286H1X2_9PROT|nr:hypothetical protein [Caenispirillum bisanense]SOE01783.1 hypothetical protein SAMN05421508_1251 [Caenispirillum bisanense]